MELSKIKTLFRFERRDIIRIAVCFVVALVDFILLVTRYSEASWGIVLFFLLTVPTFKVKGKFRFVLDIIFPVYTALFVMYYFQVGCLYDHAMLRELFSFWGFLLLQNRVVYEAIFVILVYFLCRLLMMNPKVAAIVTPVPFMLVAVINYIVYEARGHEFVFNDIISVRTALNVAGGYSFSFFIPLIFMILPYVVFIMQFVHMEVEKSTVHVAIREAVFAALTGLSIFLSILSLRMWFDNGNHMFREWGDMMSVANGYYLSFAESIRSGVVTKPEGYSDAELDSMLPSECADGVGKLTSDGDTANIIVIMNESYSDLSIYEDKTGPVKNPDPYWDSLTENTIHGYAMSSVFGGNTANSEFEFLTSLSMANLPSSSIVYHSYINDNFYSIVRALEDVGYDSFVMHPYEAEGWNRLNVYPRLGFDKMYFMDDMQYTGEDVICGKINDRCAYENMMRILDAHECAAPNNTFTYMITMQNHGGYYDENFKSDTYTTALSDYDNTCFNTFMTLTNESDKALEQLFTRLQKSEEKYVVLVFGDHQPELSLAGVEDFEPGGRAWVVPYLIWANYDISEFQKNASKNVTSLNYLALDVLEAAGFKFNNYYSVIDGIRKGLPSINSTGMILGDGTVVRNGDGLPQGADKARKLYAYLEYNMLFDGNKSLLFKNYVYN